jgi:hypothetical protein
MAASYPLLFRNHIITDGDAIFHSRNQLQGFQIAGIYNILLFLVFIIIRAFKTSVFTPGIKKRIAKAIKVMIIWINSM